ncbi:MAG: hypothetical protein IPJ41_04625 [Phycisphaerales bacterium]|nr:hypothetical protein [Phycisphaerales bacterium]
MTDALPPTPPASRSSDFGARAHRRYWWHRAAHRQYVPPVYAGLSGRWWAIIEEWFEDSGAPGRRRRDVRPR